jgi:N-acetylglucosamine repressor
MTVHRAQRSSNTLKILRALRSRGRCTISELADETRLSRLTVGKILARLAADRVVSPVGKAGAGTEGGRKPQLYRFNPAARYALGILIGERQITGRLVDLDINTVAEFRRDIRIDAGVQELVAVLDELLVVLVDRPSIRIKAIIGVGVGSQGVTDSESGVVLTSPHNPGWGSRLPLGEMVRKRLGTPVPVYVDNAIRFRTLAETTVGRLCNVQNALVIHCAEGLIAGNILNGSIYRGAHNYAGSIGHMKINVDDTERCDCGGFGCFEMQVMQRRVLGRAQALKADFPDSILFQEAGSLPNLDALFAACEAADPLARAVMNEVIGWFAIAIHNLILMFDPEMIVIQGTYAHAGDYFLTSLRTQAAKVSLINVNHRTAIECSPLSDEEACTLGAASYVLMNALDPPPRETHGARL